MRAKSSRLLPAVLAVAIASVSAQDQVPPGTAVAAVRGRLVHTMEGPPITNGVILVRDGKIEAVGPADRVAVPAGARVLEAAVVTPGLIDAHSVVGLAGWLNQEQDQDQVDPSGPIQPELRAIDAFNADDRLLEWLRGFGITTVHTGHAPAQLVPGQTMIVKTARASGAGRVLVETAAVAACLGAEGRREDKKTPGTRGKAMALLRAELVRAQEYAAKRAALPEDKRPARDLRQEILARVLARELPLLVTAQRAQDIQSALRLAKEFELRIWLDGAAEAALLLDAIRDAKVPVILHPTMARYVGDLENASFETAALLRRAEVPFALQSGYESYVPKTRVVLFEAAAARANGLAFDDALRAITLGAAQILGVARRVGSLAPGKDADFALFDGDPFEFTSHCVGTIIDGRVESAEPR